MAGGYGAVEHALHVSAPRFEQPRARHGGAVMMALTAAVLVAFGAMTITTTNDEVDYDAGNAVYTGYTLDGTTYEVTRNGYATQSHSFTC